jgi:TM2 domain-containing membrane protein YozV
MSIVAVAGMRSTAKKYDIDQSNSLFFLFQWMLLIQIHPHTKKGNIMKGQLLDFSVQKNEGVISAADGARYSFAGSEWLGDAPPSRGVWVDFEIQGTQAMGVYPALGQVSNVLRGDKSKAATTLLCAFLGGFGAHKFYMGAWGWGLVYLLTCWLYIPFIVALVEWVRYVLMTDDEFYAKLADFQSKKPGPFSFFW